MSTTPQKRALKRRRKRLNQRGMARFEILGLDADRELIRSLVPGEQANKGGILGALRRSPLVGADLTVAEIRRGILESLRKGGRAPRHDHRRSRRG
jgi:hypothetical protein